MEKHVVAAAQHILKALAASKNISDDLRKTLLDLEIHLAAMPRLTEDIGIEFKKMEKQLKFAEDKVLSWEANHSMIWDSGPEESSEYIKAVEEIQTLTQSLQSLSVSNRKQKELFQRANGVLQIAMSRLEEELVHILVQHKQFLDPEYLSFSFKRAALVYDESFVSVEDGPMKKGSFGGSQAEACNIDLVHPDALPDLKKIADVMFASNYHQEFCQAFVASRRHTLDEYFVILEMENLSIEKVLKMDWSCLNFKKWMWAMQIIIHVYLASEKQLCKQILGHMGSVYSFCFSDIAKGSMLNLLNFGEAIAMGTHTPERLFHLLDMYEALASLAVDVDVLFYEEVGSFVRGEFHNLLGRFGDTAKSTFLAFENAIDTNTSIKQFPGGSVHHLTKYVMNYMKPLIEYTNTLNLLLSDKSQIVSPDNVHETSVLSFCPMAHHFRSITAALESNLCNKAKLYKDEPLQHIFLMNNIHYMVQKVKSSELSLFFGDEWLRQHITKFQQHARSYERVTWSSVLSLLRDDIGSNCSSKANLKKRCKGFSVAFEEVYRTQTGWNIPDSRLREDLQISVSQKVVNAYRSYTGRNSSNIVEKWIKYDVDDLQNHILDLFVGSSQSLPSHERRK